MLRYSPVAHGILSVFEGTLISHWVKVQNCFESNFIGNKVFVECIRSRSVAREAACITPLKRGLTTILHCGKKVNIDSATNDDIITNDRYLALLVFSLKWIADERHTSILRRLRPARIRESSKTSFNNAFTQSEF